MIISNVPLNLTNFSYSNRYIPIKNIDEVILYNFSVKSYIIVAL